MTLFARRLFAVALYFVSLPAISFAQSRVPHHPLAALTAQEYWTVQDVLRDAGKLDEDTRVPGILLHEPPKERVLAWKAGDPLFRVADVILLRKGLTLQAQIDLVARKLLSWKERPDVYAPISGEEIESVGDAAKKDPRVIEALKKRGYNDLTFVRCEALPFGYLITPEFEGRRILNAECFDIHRSYITWHRAIADLQIQVDAADGKVVRVIDGDVVPMADGSITYEESIEPAQSDEHPIEIQQSKGPGFAVKDGEVSWQNWRFRFRIDPRIGPVVNLVRLQDGERTRSVMYEGSMSELFVPYMDPSIGWSTRSFIDSGEFFPTGLISALRQGVDCPSNAVYFDAVFSDSFGLPTIHSRRACLFELSNGQASWRHFERGEVWGRVDRVLVLRSSIVAGNYDYLIDWRFEPGGSIRLAVGATGIIETRRTKDKLSADSSMDGDHYGHFVDDQVFGVNHDHFFSFRLDLDVDGTKNSFMADRLEKRELPNSPARKSIWVMRPFMAHTEKDAMMDIRLDRPSMWRIINPSAKGRLGYPTGYELMPGTNAASLLDPEDGPQKVGAFSAHQLWITPYVPDEMYASGMFPTTGKGNDGLAVWTRANRPIENTDIVAWYTMGFHHVPRAEDWPVMPTMWHDLLIRPFDFYPSNPLMPSASSH